MKRIFCLERGSRSRHPISTDATHHPELAFEWGERPKPGCSAALVHSFPEETGLPCVFTLEECRSTWWRSGHVDCLGTMPSSAIIEMIRAKLLACDVIVTHLPQTAAVIRRMYGHEVAEKTRVAKLGIREYEEAKPKDGKTRFLFTNSFHHDPINFARRGGLEVLEAFRRVRDRFDCELILAVPGSTLPNESCVEIFREPLEDWQMDGLFETANAFLIPSIDLHSHSILRAQAHGCIPIACAAPGVSEYVISGDSGFIVNGRDQDWWQDDATGQWLSSPKPIFRSQIADELEYVMTLIGTNHGTYLFASEHIRTLVRARCPLQPWRDAICEPLLRLSNPQLANT